MTKEPKTGRNSAPSFLEQIARSRSKEHVERKKQLEDGPYHPSDDLLRQYVLAELDKSDTEIVMEHVSLCGICARKALEIKWENKETEPLIIKIKRFLSSLSFPIFVRPVSALGFAQRGGVQHAEPTSYVPGTEVILMLEAPADGYLTIFHECEETGKVELLFPLETKYASPVSGGQEIWPITSAVQGPPGKHWFTVFWTRVPVIDPAAYQLEDAEERERASADFFEALEDLKEEDVLVGTQEYMITTEPISEP